MAVEAPIMHKAGELQIEHVRAAMGDELLELSEITVFLLGRPGEMSSVGVVRLEWNQGGRGKHLAFVCGRCLRTTRMLLTDGRGGFSCRRCRGQRTRHQTEKHRTDYQYLGGRQEDRFIRLLSRVGQLSAAGLQRARDLQQVLVCGDQDRAAALQIKVDAVLAKV